MGAYGVNVFNSSLGIITEYLTETEIYAYEIGEYNIAVAHSSLDGRRSEAIIFNKRGRAEKTITFDERIIDLTLYRGYLFTQVMGGFVRTNISLNISQKIEMAANTFKIIPSDKNTLIICDSSYAKYLNFK